MWINVIILPIIVSYVFGGGSIYGATGLAGISFDYQIIALTVNLLLKLIDPVRLILRLLLAIKKTRNWIIKTRYSER